MSFQWCITYHWLKVPIHYRNRLRGSRGCFSSWKSSGFTECFSKKGFPDIGWEMLWLPWLPHAYWYWAEHCGTRPIVKHTRGSFCIFSLRSNTNWANRAHRVFSLSMVFVKKDLWKHHGWWDSPTPANSKLRFFFSSSPFLNISFLVKNISVSHKKIPKALLTCWLGFLLLSVLSSRNWFFDKLSCFVQISWGGPKRDDRDEETAPGTSL